jgi:Ser/Thr protein kinase RdoA (MazF antagonist)
MTRRLQRLAVLMLQGYDIDVAEVSFVTTAFNTVFRVDANDGSSYAFRVSPSLRIHDDLCEMAEAEWVTALRRDAEFPTPAVILTPAGFPVVFAASLRLRSRTGVLFDWVDGRTLRENMTAAGVHAAGKLAGRVHEHAAAHATRAAPEGVLVADRVLYFRLEERLGELTPTYGSVLTEAVDRAQRAVDRLWREPPHPPHLLHGDIQSGNVLVEDEQVSLIDFQDLIWGFEIHEVVIALQALAGQFPGDDALPAAFRAGYSQIRPWPEADEEMVGALTAARHLNQLNLGLSVRKPGLDEFVARHAGAVLDWMSDE